MFDLKNYFKKSSDIILTLSEHEKEINHICEEIIKASKNNKKMTEPIDQTLLITV